ncbi:MAG: hypothetical protein EOO16_12780 [Chitinophagaceae bacterium]|nr:MAG: hypothetical protein EOO16_12780 [Chitinophagaceae bacterium]
MSQAFVKESDEQWLHDVQPTLNALVVYLTRENNGIRVYEIRADIDKKTGREVHQMSNGLSYAKDANGRWEIVW